MSYIRHCAMSSEKHAHSPTFRGASSPVHGFQCHLGERELMKVLKTSGRLTAIAGCEGSNDSGRHSPRQTFETSREVTGYILDRKTCPVRLTVLAGSLISAASNDRGEVRSGWFGGPFKTLSIENGGQYDRGSRLT